MKSPVFYAIPVFLILVLIEAYLSYRKKKDYYRLNDTVTNFSLGIGSQVAGVLSKGVIFGLMLYVQRHFAFFHLPVTWWSFFLCLVLYDFLYYWAHRLSHESNFFWGAHVVHHQSEEYNLSVALRQSWIHNLISFFIFIPIPLLGFDPIIFGVAGAVDTLYQFWIHTRLIKKLPKVIEYFFNTPSHHRVHHAINPRYIDRNHAGVLIIWDRIFGTFEEEDPQEEITYGITTQLKSWNPIWANIHYYHQMWISARQMPTWADRWRSIFAKPGWLPSYLGGMQQPKVVDRTTYTKYNADTSSLLRVYGMIQFVITLLGSICYLDYFSSISTFYKLLFAVLILLSILIVGAIFEQKRWIVWAEVSRLSVVVAALNSYYYYWYQHWLMVMCYTSIMLVIASIALLVVSLYYEQQVVLATGDRLEQRD